MTDLWGPEARVRARAEAAQFRADLARVVEIRRAEGWHHTDSVVTALLSWTCQGCATRNHVDPAAQEQWCMECGDDKEC